MTQRQFEGRSAAEAAIKACEVLGLTRSALRYEVISEQGEQLARRVVISVDVSNVPASVPKPVSSTPSARRPIPTDPQAQTTTREGNFAASDEVDMPVRRNRVPERLDRSGRRGRGDADNRGERGSGRSERPGARGAERSSPRAERSAATEAPRVERADNRNSAASRGRRPEARAEPRSSAGRERGRSRIRERPPMAASNARQQDDNGIDALLSMEPSSIAVVRRASISPRGPRAQHALQAAGNLVRLMGMDLAPTLVAEDETEMHVDLVGSDEDRIIGRKGEVLLALQFVLNRIISRGEVEGEQVVVLDAGGYRERRRVALQDLATKLANRAVEARKAVRLSPMSAHDRRIFHTTLKEIEGVTTRSEGDGLYRNLLIIPAEFV